MSGGLFGKNIPVVESMAEYPGIPSKCPDSHAGSQICTRITHARAHTHGDRQLLTSYTISSANRAENFDIRMPV